MDPVGSPEEMRQRALYFTERLFKQAEAQGKGFARVHIDTVRFALGLPRKNYNAVPCSSRTVDSADTVDTSSGG